MALGAGRFTEEGTSKFIRAGGINIHYHEAGSGDPLIFLNAFGPGMTAWLTFHRSVEAFAQHYRCILMDMPNFGKTDSVVYNEPGGFMAARFVKALMDVLEIDRAPMIGNSMGGTTAITFAIYNPDRVTKMVVAGCSASTGGNVFLFNPSRMEGMKVVGEVAANPTREGFRRLLSFYVYDQKVVTDDVVDHMYQMAIDRPGHREAQRKSTNIRQNNLDELPKLQHPTLVFHGRYDLMVTPETAIQMVGLIPDCRLILMNRCGNLLPLERADEFNRITLDFLKHA